jgi:hypothetical protein
MQGEKFSHIASLKNKDGGFSSASAPSGNFNSEELSCSDDLKQAIGMLSGEKLFLSKHSESPRTNRLPNTCGDHNIV